MVAPRRSGRQQRTMRINRSNSVASSISPSSFSSLSYLVPLALDLRGDLLPLRDLPAGDDNLGAGLGQGLARHGADAARASSDDGRLAREVGLGGLEDVEGGGARSQRGDGGF